MSKLAVLNAAMAAYTPAFGRRATKPFALDEATTGAIRAIRASIRADEGGGGMCHLVTEWLQAEYGFERLNVTYLTAAGEVIFTGHVVSVLPDGSILDPTADQIGEGYDIRLLAPGDPEFGRYRPEFFEDYHPTHPDVREGELAAWMPFWDGTIDHTIQDENRNSRGEGWWLDDKRPLLDYYLSQRALGGAADEYYADWIEARISGLEAAMAACPAP